MNGAQRPFPSLRRVTGIGGQSVGAIGQIAAEQFVGAFPTERHGGLRFA